MTRKSNPSDPSGVFLIDKPAGISSFQVIRVLRRITGIRKMGHIGTLDPFATGLLPIFTGKATRIIPYLEETDKTYEAWVTLGSRTSTGDPEGCIVERRTVPDIDDDDLGRAALAMIAITSQTPPAYSAIKIAGRPSYELARKGIDHPLTERPVSIHSFTILTVDLPGIGYRARVSKGCYIRVLSESFATALGTVGTTAELRRVAIGGLSVTRGTPLAEVTDLNWKDVIKSPADFLADLPKIILGSEQKTLLAQGRTLPTELGDADDVAILGPDGSLWGVGMISNGWMHPKKVLVS